MAMLSNLMKRLFHLAWPSSTATVGRSCLFTQGPPWSERDRGRAVVTGRNSMITASSQFPFLQSDGQELSLKKHSKYYDQVQGQLYITGRRVCKFVVYTLVDVFVQEVKLDLEFCLHSLLLKLDSFYHTYYRKYIAESLY